MPCKKCGSEKDPIPKCTHEGCNAEVVVYSRPCGYLRPTSCWNEGKQQEFKDRKEFHLENAHLD